MHKLNSSYICLLILIYSPDTLEISISIINQWYINIIIITDEIIDKYGVGESEPYLIYKIKFYKYNKNTF